jgi:hypothetical protein
MAVLEGGTSASLAEVGAAAALPLHITAKPLPYGALGHYRIARRLAPAASTTTGTLWAIRNPTASGLLVVVKQLRLRLIQVGNPTAVIEDRFSLKIARGYTVADTTGSADIAPAANMQELRTSMATATAQVRESNAAGGASGGTKTIDTNAIATGSAWVLAAIQTASIPQPIEVFNYYPLGADEHPIVLASDEGVLVSNDNNLGTASGIVLFAELYWAEVAAF